MFGWRRSKRRSLLLVTVVAGPVVLAVSGFLALGCGLDPQPRESTTNASLVTTTLASADTTGPTIEILTTSTAARDTPAFAFAGLFSDLARRLAPTPVYAPTYLPAGATLAATWWPVMQIEKPADYHGVDLPNPRVDEADGKAVAAQVVMQVGQGWLAVVENYRGDLGDVENEDVGEVDGHHARLYSVNGGTAVQWSDGGMWYAVFGRNVSPAEVTKVALSMEKAAPDPPVSH